jgi:hypothetical protein
MIILIAGYSRSGSTALERVLASAPGVLALGELSHIFERGILKNQLCSCGEPFNRCPFWLPILSDAFGSFSNSKEIARSVVSRPFGRYRTALVDPRYDTTSGRLRASQLIRKLYSALIHRYPSAVFVDSSKNPVWVRRVVSEYPSSLVVHLRRDLRGVVWSNQRRKVRPEIVDRVELMPRPSAARTSLDWVISCSSAEVIRRRVQRSLLVDYSDFCRDPAATADLLLRETSIGGLDESVDWAAPYTRHSVSGNPVRFDLAPLVVREDTEWESRMSILPRATLGLIGSPIMALRSTSPGTSPGKSHSK